MSGGKETPRQKMIGLMYLVLMAMLAMNVSKEIINAFVTIDKKMHDGNVLTREGINRQVTIVNNALVEMQSTQAPPENIAKQKGLLDDIHTLIELSREVQNSLVGKASLMIMESEPAAAENAKLLGHYDNLEPKQYYSIDDDKYFQLASMTHITKKDDYDTPTRLFIGADHKNIVKEGKEIREKLSALRDELCSKVSDYTDMKGGKEVTWKFNPPSVQLLTNDQKDIDAFDAALDEALKSINPKDAPKVKQIYKILTYPNEVHNHDEMNPWVAGLFDHAPIVAAGAMFTSLKGDAERAEAIAIELIASKSEKPKFNFNKIEPLAFSAKGYINSGDTIGLSVMIAAYDSTQDLKLEYWLDDSTRAEAGMLTFEGDATKKLTLGKGMSAGKHFVYGNIEVEENGAKKKKNWMFDYTIGEPSGTVANAEMNVLYISYDNKIEVAASGYASFKASCSGCSMSGGSNGMYTATVKGGKTATITVSGVDDKGNSTTVAQKEFRIKRLPDPSPLIVGAGVESSTVKIGKIKQAQTLLAELKGSPLNVKFTVTKFTVSVVKNGEVVEARCTGNKLTGKAKNLLKGLKKGQKCYFEEVYAKGPKGGAVKIPSLIFKVI
ncbi:MAG: gliding motility-associated protein GldM [Parvicellaceae bacterium]|jgi:gliding motility-associated protein GldM